MFKIFKNYKVLLVIAAICALLVTILAMSEWNKIVGNRDVLVASAELVPGKEITVKDVATAVKNERDLPKDAVLDFAQIQGLAPRGEIPQGTLLRESMFKSLSDFGAEGALKGYPERKAIVFERNIYTTIGEQIKPDSKLDIYAYFGQKGKESKRLIGASIPVLLVTGSSSGDKNSSAVILAMTELEIQNLIQADAESAYYRFVLVPKEGS